MEANNATPGLKTIIAIIFAARRTAMPAFAAAAMLSNYIANGDPSDSIRLYDSRKIACELHRTCRVADIRADSVRADPIPESGPSVFTTV